ncbi:MAG: hypothetical protein KKC75_05775 [Nanoarchaeota archaeon]|nr:hypothetical protein [Nanoarchaeota archaeon]MBU1004915.1 hypothetical protein [Nanoarchaeota archaeon]MBU1945639.1 hypothetical protein [Nanoarchaeota archaeon]
MLEENQVEQGKSVLDNPIIAKEEALLKPQPVKKSKMWIFKLILVLLILGVVLYLFMNSEKIQSFVNSYFNNVLS